MKVKEFKTMEEFEKYFESGCYNELVPTVITENCYYKVDFTTYCKSWKTAIRRAKKAFSEYVDIVVWLDGIEESCSNGCFNCDEKNDGGWFFGVEEVADGVWYIYISFLYRNPVETSEAEEATEDYNEYEEILDSEESTEHDRIKYLMDTHSLVPHVTINSHCMETVLYMEELLTQRYGNTIAHKCKMYNNGYYGCPADRQGNRCCGEKWCAETWKRYEAIITPEWHHVSLNTLANLDFDMLDEKRQLYLKLYRELKELIQDLHKCKSVSAYERRLDKMYIRNNELVVENKISQDYINYFTRKISMCNVECGLWTSRVEEATGLHKSRRYNRYILKY